MIVKKGELVDRFEKGDYISKADGTPFSCGKKSLEIIDVTKWTYVVGDGRRIPKEFPWEGHNLKSPL